MEPLFSEFSYGYAITEELASGKYGRIASAPIFPSLFQEGKKGGYDVGIPFIGSPLFLQFKLSHYLHRSNALEWWKYQQEYYRMYLRRLMDSQQHNLLLELNKVNEVYYVAPRFYTIPDLDRHYMSDTVADHSAFIRPKDIGQLPDDDWHYITFLQTGNIGYLWSNEPIRKVKIYSKELFEEDQLYILEKLEKTKYKKIDISLLDKVANNIIEIIAETTKDKKREQTLKNQLYKLETFEKKTRFISYLSRTILDSEFIIIQLKN